MKRISELVLVAIASVLAGGLIVGAVWVRGITAQDDLAIPIRAAKTTSSSAIEAGDPCNFPGDMQRVLAPPRQVIIRDETGTIVAIEDLDGATWEATEDGDLWCIIDRDVPVPDAAFYSASVDDDYARSYDRADLPLTGDDRLIYQIAIGE